MDPKRSKLQSLNHFPFSVAAIGLSVNPLIYSFIQYTGATTQFVLGLCSGSEER